MRKPLTLFSTDWHIDKDNIEEIKSLITQKLELAKSLNINKVFGLGDFFESRKSQPLQNLKGFGEILQLFEKYGVELIAIPGNHDKLSYLSEDSYLDEFKFHPNFTLVRVYGEYSFENIQIHLLPYFEETKCDLYLEHLSEITNTIKEYNQLTNKSKHILLTHASISGVKNNDFSIVKNNVQQNLFDCFDKVFVGHYHDRSEVGINIQYIGSLQQNNFGENDQKGFCILYDDLSYELVNSNFKKYIKKTIDIDSYTQEELNNLTQKYSNSKDYVRFEFIGDEAKLKSIDDNKYKLLGIDIKKKQTIIEQGIIKASNNEFVSFTKKDILERFDKFCEKRELTNIEYGKEKLIQKLEGKDEFFKTN